MKRADLTPERAYGPPPDAMTLSKMIPPCAMLAVNSIFDPAESDQFVLLRLFDEVIQSFREFIGSIASAVKSVLDKGYTAHGKLARV